MAELEIETNTVVFWDASGEEILAITANGIASDILTDIFDTQANRSAIDGDNF